MLKLFPNEIRNLEVRHADVEYIKGKVIMVHIFNTYITIKTIPVP